MELFRIRKLRSQLALFLVFGLAASACDREPRVSANSDTIEQRYGLTEAYTDLVRSEDGTIAATVIPITLSDGRTAQLIVPKNERGRIYLRDQSGLSPVVLERPTVSREEFVRSQPRIVERRVSSDTARAVTPKKKRSLEKEILIVGGSAGAGAAIGAVAGGKKGAAIGALSGGIAGLVYDLATRNK